MKWTETVLVARRRSDGAFYTGSSGPHRWVPSPAAAQRFPASSPDHTIALDEGSITFAKLVSLTITYEVDDDLGN